MTKEQRKNYEIMRTNQLLDNIAAAHGHINKVKNAEKLFIFLLGTKYLFENERTRNAIINMIEDYESKSFISPRLQNLMMATREHIATFE